MYNIFYIYTYKYTRPSNTLTLSRPERPYKPIPHKYPNEQPHQQSQDRKPFIYGQNTQAA